MNGDDLTASVVAHCERLDGGGGAHVSAWYADPSEPFCEGERRAACLGSAVWADEIGFVGGDFGVAQSSGESAPDFDVPVRHRPIRSGCCVACTRRRSATQRISGHHEFVEHRTQSFRIRGIKTLDLFL